MKIIAADLDGTLMHTSCYVSDYSKDVIREAFRQGHIFVPTTGRCFASANQKVGDIEEVRYYITSNGCVVYDRAEEEFLFEHFLPAELAYEIYRDVKELDGAIEIYSGLDSYLAEEQFPLALKAFNKELSEDLYSTTIAVENPEEDIRSGKMKVNKFNLVFRTPEDKERIKKKYEAREDIVVTIPTIYNLEIFYAGCDKDTALDLIAKKEQVSQEDTIAIGDSFNDIRMIQYAGIGVAVGNAMQPLKDVADCIILSNNEDGPAHFIEEYLQEDCKN